MIHKLAFADYQRMPWRNGLGFTNLIAMEPPGATLATGDFDWQVELSEIDHDVAFSKFPDHDRVLAVAHGSGLILRILGSSDQRVTAESGPLEFSGELETSCMLLEGPVVAFNMIVMHGSVAARLKRWRGDSGNIRLDAPILIVHCLHGSCRVTTGVETHLVSASESLRYQCSDMASVPMELMPMELMPIGADCEVLVSEIRLVSPATP